MSFATGDRVESQPSTSSSSVQWSQSPCRHFELSEIQLATENFDESLVIGSGGFGKVYKGNVIIGSDLVVAAIKRLDSMSSQGADEFWAEVEMLSRLRHCNLVSLIGYCNYEREMILVYEYLPNGTLEDHLHKLRTPVSWIQRLNICIGAGRGLHYLHTGTGIESGVIHRDVKSSNILLHETWAAKISDFGLSKIGPTNQPSTYVNTLVKGSFGYFDPNYFATGKLTRKSDVYAFGVVLLEVLCRKRAVDRSLDEEQWGLVAWVQESIKGGNLKHIIDSDIRGEISPKCLKEFVRIAERCLQNNPKLRPTMAEVVVTLESVLTIQEKMNNSIQAADRRIFNKVLHMLPFSSNGEKSVQREPKLSSNSEANILERPTGNLTPSRSLKAFTFADLKGATTNFSPKFLLGQGGFGEVFLGWVDPNTLSPSKRDVGMAVAVKRLNKESMQGHAVWEAEMNFLGKFSHPNLVKLFGYCYVYPEFLLVYEFMEKGSLEEHLFRRGSTVQPLPWDIRLKITTGAARGLAFLHASENSVIYRDFNTSNILLDGAYNAKLSHALTQVMGTHGYAAPEYVAIGTVRPTGKTSSTGTNHT